MELIGVGRMAEVYAVGNDTVLKLDRVEFNGAAEHEAVILREVARAGLPVPHVVETVMVDGRHGIVMEQLHGPLLTELIRTGGGLGDLAEKFVELHTSMHAFVAPSAPDLIERLAAEIERSDLPVATRTDLVACLRRNDGATGLCHFDFHADNVIVTESGWKVIDWLTAASGPPIADFARSLLLRADSTDDHSVEFMTHVRRHGIRRRELNPDEIDAWTRIVAAARLSEGFTGDYSSRLRTIALNGA